MLKLLKKRLGQVGSIAEAVWSLQRDGAARRRSLDARLAALQSEVDVARILAAQNLIAERRRQGLLDSIHDSEFRVSSQFGDDGIIQYLLDILDVGPRAFVEFGVADYREANTRFLLEYANWRGLLMEGDRQCIRTILQSPLMWRHDLTVRHAFVDCDNVNDLLGTNGFGGHLGLLSIDIDGNDYWVWKALTVANPAIVIVEYNSTFGPDKRVTIPYDPSFARDDAHYSRLYYGASLAALCSLAREKGYAFVGCNSAGNNAYFVRDDRIGALRPLSSQEGFTDASFRESRAPSGELAFLKGRDRLLELADMPLVDLEAGRTSSVRDIYAWGETRNAERKGM